MMKKQEEELSLNYRQRLKKAETLIVNGSTKKKEISFFDKLKINQAIKRFTHLISLNPNHYQTVYFLGKLYQQIGQYTKALGCFERALNLEKYSPAIAQEASLAAMHLNEVDKAVDYSHEAVRRSPDNFALLGNHSLNLLLAKYDNEAMDTINKAIALNPQNETNLYIRTTIEEVISGKVLPSFK